MTEKLIQLDLLLMLISEELTLSDEKSLELSEAIFREISKYR